MDELLSDEQVRQAFKGGPDPKNAVLLVIGDAMYARDGKCWRKLDDKTYRTVEEMTRARSD